MEEQERLIMPVGLEPSIDTEPRHTTFGEQIWNWNTKFDPPLHVRLYHYPPELYNRVLNVNAGNGSSPTFPMKNRILVWMTDEDWLRWVDVAEKNGLQAHSNVVVRFDRFQIQIDAIEPQGYQRNTFTYYKVVEIEAEHPRVQHRTDASLDGQLSGGLAAPSLTDGVVDPALLPPIPNVKAPGAMSEPEPDTGPGPAPDSNSDPASDSVDDPFDFAESTT
jgi:hypothetical protein